MKTSTPKRKVGLVNRISAMLATIVASILIFTSGTAQADVPDRQYIQLNGMYQVVSSNDPLFPVQPGTEWFMDFGRGIHDNTICGSVAVSRRQNPDVKVRIMAWQYIPTQSNLVIGNQFERGAANAVAKGVWNVATTSQGIIFHRGQYQMVVRRADLRDY